MPMALKAVIIPVTPFQQNCTVLWDDETMRGAVSDPGGDLERIEEVISAQGIVLEKILLTHGHLDHASGAGALAVKYKVPIEGPHRDDQFLISDLRRQGEKYGFPLYPDFEPDLWLEDGDEVSVGNLTFGVRHCPGHTPGHVVFFHQPSQLALVGDVLFKGSIGRTDLPRGNYQTLIESIRDRLWPLGEAMTFVPGHGPVSTFGYERKTNPFVADNMLD
ncbi:MAG: MBL fold metallo-hydrolase [Parvibaculaceae bacterium]|nr:MBL fold metallo-hydrolase [Parvibaculaceae bacterium]